MSQLSSGGRVTRQKTKKSYDTLWFLLAFTVICIIVTIICIYNTLHSEKTKALSADKNIEQTVLGDKTWINAIKTDTVSYHEGNIVFEYDNPNLEPLYEYEISYDQISGLKNKKNQEKINEDIKSEVLKLKGLLRENPKFDRISITSYVAGNFADVLSVSISYYLSTEDRQNYESMDGTVGLNYRLDTAEKLSFEDLFFETSSIKSILSQSLYEAFAWEHMYNDDNMQYNFNKTDYGYIENQTFKALSEYNKNPDLEFYFTSTKIYPQIKDFSFSIDMAKFAKDIALYSSYKADNIYQDESLKKDIYAFSENYIAECVEVEGTRGDNFYYEILSYPIYEYEDENADRKRLKKDALEVVKGKVDEKLGYYYDIAQKNPDKGYMVSVIYYCDMGKDQEFPYYQYTGSVSETDIEFFNTKKDEVIAKSRNSVAGELSNADFYYHDDNVEFYESFNAYVDDYRMQDYQEDIMTKAEKEEQDRLWKQDETDWEDTLFSM